MTVYDLKPAFQNLLRPLCRALAARGVSANQVTLAALILSLLSGGAIWLSGGARWTLLVLPLVLFVRMALNAIDGMLAREHDMQSAKGAILNEMGDVISDAALYLPFALLPGMPRQLLVVGVVLAVMVEMCGVVVATLGAKRSYAGPMGKSDRAVLFGALALLFAFGVEGGWWLSLLLGIWNLLQLRTLYNRARAGLQEVAA